MTFETLRSTSNEDKPKNGTSKEIVAAKPLSTAPPQPKSVVLPARQPLPRPLLHREQTALKLGLDVHLEFIMAVAQRAHGSPQAPRKFTSDAAQVTRPRCVLDVHV
jgi:hypothetical protein